MADFGGFSEPRSLDEMRGYIFMQLGKPNICVEVPDVILNQIVMDAVGWFWSYANGLGSHEEYIVLKMSPGRTKYKIPNLVAVGESNASGSDGGINTLFSPMHNLLYKDWVILGNYPGSGGSGEGQGMSLATYDIAMMYLKDIDRAFGLKYRTRYDMEREVLSVYPEPRIEHALIIKAFVKQAPQFLFKNVMFRRYCVARAREWWGNSLGKFLVQIPGGGTIAANEIYQRGHDEAVTIEEQIRMESEPPIFCIG